MQSYLPSGVLDAFIEGYLRSEAPGESGSSEPTGRIELVPHRNAKTVYEHRYLDYGLIAKVYDDVRDGALAFEVWHTLWSQGFGPDAIFKVPEPLIYLPERRTFLMELASGTCLLPLVLRDRSA